MGECIKNPLYKLTNTPRKRIARAGNVVARWPCRGMARPPRHLPQRTPGEGLNTQAGEWCLQGKTMPVLFGHGWQYNAIQCTTMQCNTMLYNAIQCDTMQYNAKQCSTMQYNAIQCNTMQYNTMQYNAIQCNTMQYNATQCNAMQCNAMHCDALHGTAMQYAPDFGPTGFRFNCTCVQLNSNEHWVCRQPNSDSTKSRINPMCVQLHVHAAAGVLYYHSCSVASVPNCLCMQPKWGVSFCVASCIIN